MLKCGMNIWNSQYTSGLGSFGEAENYSTSYVT